MDRKHESFPETPHAAAALRPGALVGALAGAALMLPASDVAAQQRALASAAAPDVDTVVVQGPTQYGPPGTPPKRLQIRFTKATGLECEGKTTITEDADGTHVAISFDGKYLISLSENQTKLSTLSSCVIQLKIEGASNLRFNVARLKYAGSMFLPDNQTKMSFNSDVYWKSSQFDIPEDAHAAVSHFGEATGQPWKLNHEFETVNDGWSKCLTSDTDSDSLVIETGLLLRSRAPVNAEASVAQFSASADSQDDATLTAPVSPNAPSTLLIDIKRDACGF